jgi:tRNA threonylcarbamoyladenosine biosynthesis protein TsaB
MKILSIDTTTMMGSVALSDGNTLIADEQHGIRSTHSERLISSIDQLLDVAGWNTDMVEGIAVAVGPGSFTGLRIGLATAKGMSLAMGCPLVGVSSLECLALNARGADLDVVSLIDARRGELYAAVYSVDWSGKLVSEVGECVMPPEALVEKLKNIDGELVLVGDGVDRYADLLKASLGDKVYMPGGLYSFPRAHNIAILAADRFARGDFDELSGVTPNYIRRSDAEIGFKGQGAKHK